MPKKSKALLDRLPEDQFDALVEWLSIEGLTYEQTRDKLAEDYGVTASVGMLWSFYQKHCIGYKHKKARKLAETVGEMYRTETDFSDLTIKAVEQRAFELSMCRDASIDELGKLAKMIGDSRKLELQEKKLGQDERKIALLEAKAAFVDEMKDRAENREGGLTPEDMEEIERKLKLL